MGDDRSSPARSLAVLERRLLGALIAEAERGPLPETLLDRIAALPLRTPRARAIIDVVCEAAAHRASLSRDALIAGLTTSADGHDAAVSAVDLLVAEAHGQPRLSELVHRMQEQARATR